MPRLVYACRFEMAMNDGPKAVLSAYSDWITQHYRKRRGLPNFSLDLEASTRALSLPSGHAISSTRFESAKGQAVQIEWTYPADNDESWSWRSSIRVGTLPDRCSIEHLVWIDSIEHKISPLNIALGSPSVIRELCSKSTVQIGDMKVKATPYVLDTPGVADFLTLLQSPMRRLPIVFLAPYSRGDPNMIDAAKMAQRLAGVGIVVVAKSSEVTWDLSDSVGRSLSCFNGAARIYWPGFDIADAPRRHPLYFGQRIANFGGEAVSRAIERPIYAVASFRFAPDARISAIIEDAQDAERAKRLESEKSSAGMDWETYALDIDNELSKAKQAILDLQAENENLKANQQIYFSSSVADGAAEDLSADEVADPASMEEAVLQAQGKLSNLIILESAVRAAAKSPFQRPAEIAEALSDLDEIAFEWGEQKKAKGSGGDLRQHLIARGWGKRCSMHISDTTKKKYGTSYTFQYDEADRLFEPHITIGSGDANSCASIHFIVDERKSKIVVAHIGRHLPNTKT